MDLKKINARINELNAKVEHEGLTDTEEMELMLIHSLLLQDAKKNTEDMLAEIRSRHNLKN